MKLFGPLARAVVLTGLSLAGVAAPSAAFAGPAELELLRSYEGEWRGRGQLIGAESESVVCRLNISKGNGDKVNYQGRCAVAGQTVAVNGTLAYIDARRRFEAAMTTNAGFTGLAIGQKRGGGIRFDLREREKDEGGNDLQIAAAIDLNKGQIVVNFDVTYVSTGDTIKASVPFTK
jgi:hypothetical protein